MVKTYAVIEAGKVTNLVLAEPDVAAAHGWIEANDTVRIGDFYDNGFIQQVTSTVPTVPIFEFFLLFTPDERVQIRYQADGDDRIDDMLNLVNDSRVLNIDLSLLPIRRALDYLVEKGLLTESRRGEILRGEIR